MTQFRKLFYDTYLVNPSLNVILGAELVNWISANALFVNDYDLRISLDQKGYHPGKLTWGFNFQNTNNNTYSPVFK
ncbi:hypothetical protein, partial [Christiangramia aquimixticola]